MSAFHVGDIWEPEVEFRNKKKELVDPASVTGILKKPNGQEVAVTLTKIAVGVYEPAIELTEAGPWTLSAKCTGGYQGSEPETIQCFGVFGG